MMKRSALILLLAVLLGACRGASPTPTSKAPAAMPAQTKPELVAIDLFGTQQVTLEHLLATCGKELRAYGEAMFREDPDGQIQTNALLAKLHGLGDFADITLSPIGYYEPGGMKYHLTVDFVDRADASRRMAFSPSPTGTYEDPDGLLANWHAYEAKLHELMGSGQMHPKRIDCPAFHCLGDHRHADVKQLSSKFVAHVPARVAELAAILRDDQNAGHRAAAAYLLAYTKDGPALVKLLLPAFDSEDLVRNNAMRVVADIALHHPEVEVPLDPVLDALDHPTTLDRNKAVAILDFLLKRPGAARLHRPILLRAGTTLMAMLRLQQPNNHDFAYSILKAISGQHFGARDYPAWEAWLLAQQAAQRSPAP